MTIKADIFVYRLLKGLRTTAIMPQKGTIKMSSPSAIFLGTNSNFFYQKTSVTASNTTKLTKIPKFLRSLTASRPYFINNFKYMEKQNCKNIQ